jgi:hypothetical protein
MALCICINYFYPSMLFLPLVNFNIILRKHFLYKSASHSFSLITVRIFTFWSQNIGAKCECKMLMKLTPGVNFINIIRANFSYECLFGSFLRTYVRRKKLPNRQCTYEKFVRKMLMKLTAA